MAHLLLDIPLGYYACLYIIYLALVAASIVSLRRQRPPSDSELRRIAASGSTPSLSLIMPAYNEEKIVIGAVRAALNLRLPQYDVILVNDGSSDRTLDVLIEGFALSRDDRPPASHLATQPVRGVYRSTTHPNLLVVDKQNGRRADAINAGANRSRHELLFIMDTDSILEEDALLRSVHPFMEDPRVVGAGGVIRPLNGLKVDRGRIVATNLPRGFLARLQAVEYLRSFQWARLGLARLNSMLSISGAFMVVKRELFLALGGCDAATITDDIEFTIRLNRFAYDRRNPEPCRIVYLPDAIGYTEVPETIGILGAQRNRWQRGILQSLGWHFAMMLNPRYGITGLLGMPFFALLSIAPLVEAAGYVAIVTGLVIGAISWFQLVVFLGAVILLGLLLSGTAIALQAASGRKMPGRDILRLLAVGCLENFGYQQLHILWRIAGTFDYLVRGRTDLGKMVRYGAYQEDLVVKPAAQDMPLRAAE